MKKMLLIIIVLSCFSCVKEAPGGKADYVYVNQSGVKVAIVSTLNMEYKNKNYPDSLVLENGESFTYTGYGKGMGNTFPAAPFKSSYSENYVTYDLPVKIYFDDKVRMVYYYNDPSDRNPFRNVRSYDVERPDKDWKICTYTVTEEDYQYAFEHGEVVEKTE